MHATHYRRSWPFVCTILVLLFLSAYYPVFALTSTTNTAVIENTLTQRAHQTPTGSSEGSGGSEGDYSDESEDVVIDYDDYVHQGEVVARYLRSSDADIIADLVSKGKLQRGQQLASRFTDVSALRSNGWEGTDDTEVLKEYFIEYAPFHAALRSLGVNDQARPDGKNERITYQHKIWWRKGGRLMQPVGGLAAFDFVTNPPDACLIITQAYSTQYWIQTEHLDQEGIESPPLSHKSDIAFLEWKRVCAKYRTDTKHLKHIILSVITTPATQKVVKQIFQDHGRTVSDWTKLPLWEQRLTFGPDSNEGKALLATVQVKGIMWMLIQHRQQLGKKAIKQISVFKDEITGMDDDHATELRGPSFYLELEDVQ